MVMINYYTRILSDPCSKRKQTEKTKPLKLLNAVDRVNRQACSLGGEKPVFKENSLQMQI